MSNWQTKSEATFEAANILLQAKLFNPSVHPHYYACVQMVYQIFNDHFGMSIEEIEVGSKLIAPKLGTHQWLRKEIFTSLLNKDKAAAADFNDFMGQLCAKRVKADYLFNIIGEKEANKCRYVANDILDILKKYYYEN